LEQRFGGVGIWILLLTITAISFVLATDRAFFPAISALSTWLTERREQLGQSLVPAIGSWCRDLALGLWDFLRGADLEGAIAAKKPIEKKKVKRHKPELEDEYEYEDEEEEEEDEYEEEEEEEEEEDEYEEEEEEEEEEDEYEEEEDEYEEELEEDEPIVPSKPMALPIPAKQPVYEPPTPPPGPWTLPPTDLLVPPSGASSTDNEFLERNALALERALKSFKVSAEVVGVQVGPAVTLFELSVAEGTRMNRVTNLSQEIAATLRAKSVRIIAPIPGKSTIGIEIPNTNRRKVRISELISQKAYDKKFMALPLFLGMDAEGQPIVEDLARMPHLLIAGTTGSGKSVCINTIVASLLLTRSPHDVRLILVDPKMVELMMFAGVPHLELPVVNDMRQATNVLNWAVEKMEARYELFKSAQVKNIKGYNALGEEELRKRLGDGFNDERTPRHVPYIVLIIDEMADLMLQSKKDAEAGIMRLAQKSRAVGIHVIVATQRPSTDVITGVIKGNLPTRIAFQVASKIDSRVILDASGADKLLGEGDMLFSPPQSSQLRRVQGAMIEDEELQRIVDFVTKEAPQIFNQELVQSATGTAAGGVSEGGDKLDDLFIDAVRVVLKSRRGSASLLQRALGIGYTRASRLIDQMTDAGIVGSHQGSKSREILMTLEDFEENIANAEA
jgi:S-DNA-T family DNA segregation ATPase FtsK/SpoIIIE